jgi:hypothetical protein
MKADREEDQRTALAAIREARATLELGNLKARHER